MTEGNFPPPEAAAGPLVTPSDQTTPRRSLRLNSPSGLPPWATLLALAVVPALIVGFIVFFLARGGSSGGNDTGLAASVVDGFLRLGGSNDDPSSIQSYVNKLPPGYPGDLPRYPGSKLIGSYSMNSSQGVTYFALYSSSDAVGKIEQFFSDRLDKDPWQLTAAQNSSTSTGVRFQRPSDPDIDGSISVNRSDLDPRSTIYISVQDSSSPSGSASPTPMYTPSPSLVLPPGFPNDVPIYKSNDPSVVTDTLFQRDSGSTSYLVSFITKNGQNAGDVLDYYRNEFQKRGWSVNDSKPASSTSLSQGIDFQDGPNKGVQGTVSADVFASDRSYTKVDLEVHVSNSRPKGN
jgi:hypothetical protein